MPDNTGIRAKKPEKKQIDSKKRTDENDSMRRSYIIQTRTSKEKKSKKERQQQHHQINANDDPAGQITQIMHIQSKVRF